MALTAHQIATIQRRWRRKEDPPPTGEPGLSMAQMGREYGCATTTIRYHLRGIEVGDPEPGGLHAMPPPDPPEVEAPVDAEAPPEGDADAQAALERGDLEAMLESVVRGDHGASAADRRAAGRDLAEMRGWMAQQVELIPLAMDEETRVSRHVDLLMSLPKHEIEQVLDQARAKLANIQLVVEDVPTQVAVDMGLTPQQRVEQPAEEEDDGNAREPLLHHREPPL